MDISQSQNDGVVVLTLAGRLDTHSAPELQVPLLECIQSSPNVVIDFGQIDYLSSAGLRVLLLAQKTAQAKGTKLAVANVNPDVMEVFDITGFTGLLDITDPEPRDV